MDIKDRVMGDQPNDFFHQIAGIVPGYHGYTDRERRRDADKILRTTLAHQFSAQHDRLTRIQQSLLLGHHLEEIAEIDRLAGALQRFVDRLSMATYGYSGLFDPIKVEAADLDQLYAFDMALASGVDRVSSAIDALDAAATGQAQGPAPAGAASGMPELPAAIARLASLLDELNQRLNERADLLTSGKRLPDNDYNSMLSNLNQPTIPGMSGEIARYSPGSVGSSGGTPTTSFNMSAGGGPLPETPTGAAGSTGAASIGIETASSPVDHPGAPGGDIVKGLEMTPNMGAGNVIAGPDASSDLTNAESAHPEPRNPEAHS